MKGVSNKLLNVAVAAVFAVTLVAAAGSPVSAHQAGSHAGKGLKTLRWYGLAGTATWPATLDPSQITDSISYNVANQTQGNLVRLAPGGAVIPDLAKSWSVSKNHKVYIFHLRSGLRFADGHKLTASDVKYSLTRALLKKTASPVALLYDGAIKGAAAVNSGKTNKLSGVVAVNSHTVKITLSSAIPYFLKTLTYPTADVLDPKVVRGKPANTFLTNTCVEAGAGQFVFKCRNHKTDPNHSGFFPSGRTPSITLVPNKHYWGTKPHIKLVMVAIADTQTNYKDYKAGSIDVTAIPTADLSAESKSSQFRHFKTSVTDYMTANQHSDSVFHNVHCRLAVAYAINRVAINAKVLHHSQLSTYQVLPANLTPTFSKKYYTPKKSAKAYGSEKWTKYDKAHGIPYYDPKKAKKELKSCPKLKGGYQVVIPYQHTSVDIDNEYGAIVAMLGAVGINAKLEPLTFNDWLGVVANPNGLDKTGKGKVDITENLWIEDYPDPEDYMYSLLDPTANYDIGYFNNGKYNRLERKANHTFNPGTRARLYQSAENIALSQGAWIAVGNALGFALVKPNVHGLVGSAAYGILVPKGDNWSNVSV